MERHLWLVDARGIQGSRWVLSTEVLGSDCVWVERCLWAKAEEAWCPLRRLSNTFSALVPLRLTTQNFPVHMVTARKSWGPGEDHMLWAQRDGSEAPWR